MESVQLAGPVAVCACHSEYKEEIELIFAMFNLTILLHVNIYHMRYTTNFLADPRLDLPNLPAIWYNNHGFSSIPGQPDSSASSQ